MPDQGNSPEQSGGAHPFLTAKGLRLQQLGRKDEFSMPMAMPSYPLEVSPYSGGVYPSAPIDPFDFAADRDKTIHNVRPSIAFPRVESLLEQPLNPYFQTRLVARPQSNQLRAIGKLFIQISGDTRLPLAMGSAWITGPSTIATAAHNLYDSTTRTWSRALEFHAGYDYYNTNDRPTCRVTGAYIPRSYLNNPATNLDIAICYVDRNIGDIVGTQIRTKVVTEPDYFDNERVAIVGYPAGSGFDFGKQLWQSEGDYLFGQGNGPDSDFAPVMATNFGGGASGCPWLVEDKAAGPGKYVAVGVTSGHAKLRYARGELNLNSL
ncbi:MAG: glutamyl endopeptidase, partial [Rubripirellula sp.]